MALRQATLMLIAFLMLIASLAQNIESPVLLYLIYPTAPQPEQNQVVLLNLIEQTPAPVEVPVQIVRFQPIQQIQQQAPQISTAVQLQTTPVIQQQIPVQRQQIPIQRQKIPISLNINPISTAGVDRINTNQVYAERKPVSVKSVKPGVQLDESTYCPSVPESQNFNLQQQLGTWYIIESTLDLPDCAFAVRKESFRFYGLSSTYWDNRSQVKPLNLTHYIGQPAEQILSVNYVDRKTNNMVNKYYGRTSRGAGGSYTNKFTTGSTSNVTIVAADYNRETGYILMITCTKQSNGELSVNSNILSRSPTLDAAIVSGLRSLLTQYGLTEVESQLKVNNQKNCYLLGELTQKKGKVS